MTFACNSLLKSASTSAKSIDEVLSPSDQREEDTIPSMRFIWLNSLSRSRLCLFLIVIFKFLNDEIAIFFEFDCIVIGKLSKYFTRIHSCWLIEMAPMPRTSKRTFELMWTWCSYSDIFSQSPSSGLVNQTGSKRITVLSQHKEALISDF